MNNYIDEITKLAITEQEKSLIDIIFSIYNNEYIDYNDYIEHSKKLLKRENSIFYGHIPLLSEELFNYIQSKSKVKIDEEVLKDNIANELYELDFSVYDVIILEDYDGSIYQESIHTITKAYCGLEKIIHTNKFDIKLSSDDVNIFEDGRGHCPNTIVKEVWHRVDNETFKRIYTNSRLIGCTIDNNCVKIEGCNECLNCVEAFRYGVPCPDIDGECPYKRGR